MNVIQNSSLIIIPANVSDAVTYTCVATNMFGRSSFSAAVTVHCKLYVLLYLYVASYLCHAHIIYMHVHVHTDTHTHIQTQKDTYTLVYT